MQKFISYIITFLIGGAICAIVQLCIIRTRWTSSRILVSLVVIGAILEATTAFKYMEDFAGSGVRVPILGFGASLARGAIKGARERGFLGVLAGPLEATAIGISVAVLSAYLIALIFKSKTKKG